MSAVNLQRLYSELRHSSLFLLKPLFTFDQVTVLDLQELNIKKLSLAFMEVMEALSTRLLRK